MKVHVYDSWVLRPVGVPWWRCRWRWHVRCRLVGDRLTAVPRVVNGRAWTYTGGQRAVRRVRAQLGAGGDHHA